MASLHTDMLDKPKGYRKCSVWRARLFTMCSGNKVALPHCSPQFLIEPEKLLCYSECKKKELTATWLHSHFMGGQSSRYGRHREFSFHLAFGSRCWLFPLHVTRLLLCAGSLFLRLAVMMSNGSHYACFYFKKRSVFKHNHYWNIRDKGSAGISLLASETLFNVGPVSPQIMGAVVIGRCSCGGSALTSSIYQSTAICDGSVG